MLDTLVTLLIGFSVISLAVLLSAYLAFFHAVQKTWLGTAACVVLCAGLAGLQLAHLFYLQTGADLLGSRGYVALLFIVPAAFYFFSRDIVLPGVKPSPRDALHAAPFAVGALLPPALVAPAAFVVGAGYSIWLARVVYGMRRNVKRFRFEMFFFALFAIIAAAVLALVVSLPWLGTQVFYLFYAASIGLTVMLVTAALLIFPEILTRHKRGRTGGLCELDADRNRRRRESGAPATADGDRQALPERKPEPDGAGRSGRAQRAPAVRAHQHALRRGVFPLRARTARRRSEADPQGGPALVGAVDRHDVRVRLAVELLCGIQRGDRRVSGRLPQEPGQGQESGSGMIIQKVRKSLF